MAFAEPSGIDSGSPKARAAQYVRVSTDHQKYSIENQAAAIAAYAARRNISIVRTYSDVGRSGVRIAGRDALQKVISDVQLKRADFDCILVYDISRWGRFQDVDESAYYEFICRRAGINVHYCADEFENDGSLASIVLKNIKRVAAADYSRQLSKKVFLGQCRVTTLGHWRGGPASYGLRRMLVDEAGRPKLLLEYGQRKNLKTEHVVLVPGPKAEIKIVQEIFTSFANEEKTRTEIANDLNVRGIRNAIGKPWSMLTVSNILKNEVYLGNIIFNRRSQKLGEKQVVNPRDMWIRHDSAFRPIISPKLFARAQEVRDELRRGRARSDKDILNDLSALLKKEGRLSLKIMLSAKGVPNPSVYARRFGSVMKAYKLIGYKPEGRYSFLEIAASVDTTIQGVARQIIAAMEKRRANVSFLPELYLLTINHGLTVGMAVARAVRNGTGTGPSRRWEIRKVRFRRSDFTLIMRLNSSNTGTLDYFLVPSASLPTNPYRVRISERNFGEFRYDDLKPVVKALESHFL